MPNMRHYEGDAAGIYFFCRARRASSSMRVSHVAGIYADYYTLKNTSKNWHFCYDIAACG